MRTVELNVPEILTGLQSKTIKDDDKKTSTKFDVVYVVYQVFRNLNGEAYMLFTTSMQMVGAINIAIKTLESRIRERIDAEDDENFDGVLPDVPDEMVVVSILRRRGEGNALPSNPKNLPGRIVAIIT